MSIGTKLGLSFGFAITLVAFILYITSPKSNTSQVYLSNTEHIDPKMVKFIETVGGDVLDLIPGKLREHTMSNKEVQEVFKTSGNPWRVTELDFFVLRVSYGFIYSVIGLFFSLIVGLSLLQSLFIIVGLGFVGWNKPVSEYRKIAEERSKDFKKYFPELLDYLTMELSTGGTLSNAIEVAVPYVPESAVKEEFEQVIHDINAGMTIEASLNDLSQRVPSVALEAFVKAVNNANKLDTPMNDLLRARARNTRKDLINEIELIIQDMPTKVMIALAPATIISMIIIIVVPMAVAMLGQF